MAHSDATIRSIVDMFGDATRSLLEKQSFAYIAESTDAQALTSSPTSEYHWFAGLPPEGRASVYRVRDLLGLLESVCADAVGRVKSHAARERLTLAARVLIHQLGQVIMPNSIRVWIDESCTEEQVARARREGYSRAIEVEKGSRLDVLEKYLAGMGAVAEELDAIATVTPVDESPARPAATHDAADLALMVNALEEAKRLAVEGEGPYVTLIDAMPMVEVMGLTLKEALPLPAATPRTLLDWDAPRFSKDHHRLLGESRALYERLKARAEDLLGTQLGWRSDQVENEAATLPPDLPGLDARRTGLMAGRLKEDFYWLGTILPIGKRLPHSWIGWDEAAKLKVFMTEKAHACFANVRDVLATIQNRLMDLQIDAERRVHADERISAREAAGTKKRRRTLGAKDEGGIARFPTPEGAEWKMVKITMQGDQWAKVRMGRKSKAYTYDQMGMLDRRSNGPTKQWDLLQEFARNEGTFDWTSKGAKRTQQKQRELLAKVLCRFFGIKGDPFSLTVDGKGWVARFNIRSLG